MYGKRGLVCLESSQRSHGLEQGGGRLCPDSPELSRAAVLLVEFPEKPGRIATMLSVLYTNTTCRD